MKSFLCVIILLSQIAAAQKVKKLSPTEFLRAKVLYLEMSQTQLYADMRKASLEFVKRLPEDVDWDRFGTEEEFREWVALNLSKSSFSSVDEALYLRRNSLDLKTRLLNENREVHQLLARADKEQFREIIKPDTVPYRNN